MDLTPEQPTELEELEQLTSKMKRGRPLKVTPKVTDENTFTFRTSQDGLKFFNDSCNHILKSKLWKEICSQYLDGRVLKTKKDVVLALVELVPEFRRLADKYQKRLDN